MGEGFIGIDGEHVLQGLDGLIVLAALDVNLSGEEVWFGIVGAELLGFLVMAEGIVIAAGDLGDFAGALVDAS